MGRTVPSYRMALEAEIEAWKPFRDALRIDERKLFDDLMNLARERASAGGAAARCAIAEAMFMTILFQHHRLIKQFYRLLAAHADDKKRESGGA